MAAIYPKTEWKYGSVAEYILTLGREYTFAPLPPDVERKAEKECFYNAALLALGRPDLIYVEGYGMAKGCPLPVLHAWCTLDGKTVIDPTWEEGVEYYGVPMETRYLYKRLHRLGIAGGLIDDWEGLWPLLRGVTEAVCDEQG